MREGGVVWRVRLYLGGQCRVELNLHVLFVPTLITLTWILAIPFLPNVFPGWHPLAYWLVATTVTLTDTFAALVHELGHAIAALARGRRVYRITLYGVAAAVRRSSGPPRPRDQFAIALAGPVSHLLVASALLCAWTILPNDNEPLRVAAGFPAVSNLAVGMLNLLPIAPLDGARVARALVAGMFRV
jgi:Zn-dependent protease